MWKGKERMKEKYMILFLGVLFVAMMVSVLSAQPDEIVFNNVEAFKKKQRPAVVFPHEIHMAGDLSCTDCHHRYDNSENILDESELEEGTPDIRCFNCHNRESRINLRHAFHRQCIGCHGRTQKEGKETGPRLCGECHPRS